MKLSRFGIFLWTGTIIVNIFLLASTAQPIAWGIEDGVKSAESILISDDGKSRGRRIKRNKSYGAARSSFSDGRRPGQVKRDFQDHSPPRTAQQLYQRYDPSVAVSTGVVLGGILGFIVGRVMLKCVVRFTKRQLRKTKRFGKYFPERELPPLHIAQQIAREHGIALPESLISKLVREGPDPNLKLIANNAKSPAAIAAAAISPLIIQQQHTQHHVPVSRSPSAAELLGLIRVNIIGATPAVTPSASHKTLPTFTSPLGPVGPVGLNGDHNRMRSSAMVTAACIEMQPLLRCTTTSTAKNSLSASNPGITGNTKTFLQTSTEYNGRKISSSSYCLAMSNGAAANATKDGKTGSVGK